MKQLNELGPNDAVHCKTQEEADEIARLDPAGEWINMWWNPYTGNICLYRTGELSTLGHAECAKFAIHLAFDLIAAAKSSQVNIPAGCIPFDVEVALKQPVRVVTRDGRSVTDLHHFASATASEFNMFGVVGKELESWYVNGSFLKGGEPENLDLFLKAESVVYYSLLRPTYVGATYSNLEKAVLKANKSDSAILKVTITGERIETEVLGVDGKPKLEK